MIRKLTIMRRWMRTIAKALFLCVLGERALKFLARKIAQDDNAQILRPSSSFVFRVMTKVPLRRMLPLSSSSYALLANDVYRINKNSLDCEFCRH